jgi:hypothetical protein
LPASSTGGASGRGGTGLQSRQQGRLAHQRRNGEVAGDGEFADRGFIADIDFATRSAQARTGARREFLQVVGVIKIHARLWHRMAAAIVPAMSELQDLVALIRADTPLLVIETPDEARVVDLFRQALMHAWRALYRWSVTEGLRRIDMDREDEAEHRPRPQRDPAGDPQCRASAASTCCWTPSLPGLRQLPARLRDLDPAPRQPAARAGADRHQGRAAGRTGSRSRCASALRLPDANALLKLVKEEAAAYTARERRPPGRSGCRRGAPDRAQPAGPEPDRRAPHRAPADLRDGALGPGDLPELATAEVRAAQQERPPALRIRHRALRRRRPARGAEALGGTAPRALRAGDPPPPGLEPPKGVLLLGVQGCGKSMLAKAVAGGFGVPLVRLDFGTLYDKYHGETEKNLRAALASTEQLAPCVLWIDEIEKGLAAGNGDERWRRVAARAGLPADLDGRTQVARVPGRHRQPGA